MTDTTNNARWIAWPVIDELLDRVMRRRNGAQQVFDILKDAADAGDELAARGIQDLQSVRTYAVVDGVVNITGTATAKRRKKHAIRWWVKEVHAVPEGNSPLADRLNNLLAK